MISSDFQLKIGSVINVPGERKGVLKFIGRVEGKAGLFAGIELIDGSTGRNSGEFNGKQYFQVSKPNAGLFYTYDSVVVCNLESDFIRETEDEDLSNEQISDLPVNRRVSSNFTTTTTQVSKSFKNKRLSLDSQVSIRNASRRSISSSLNTSPKRSNERRVSGAFDSANVANGSSASRRRVSGIHENLNGSSSSVGSRRVSGLHENINRRSVQSLSSTHSKDGELLEKLNTLTSQHNTLIKEKSSLASQLLEYQTKLEEKIQLLTEYKKSIDENYKPTIEDYKYQLEQKDIKLTKIKQQADQQRDELREAISALEDQASENAELYTSEVEHLKQEIYEQGAVIQKLNDKVKELKKSNSEASKQEDFILLLQHEIEEKNENIEELKRELSERQKLIDELSAMSNSNLSTTSINTSTPKSAASIKKVNDIEINRLSTEFKRIKFETALLTEEIIEKDEIIQNLSNEISLLRTEHDLNSSLLSKNKEVEALSKMGSEQEASLAKDIEVKNKEIANLKAMLDDLKKHNEVREAEISELRQENQIHRELEEEVSKNIEIIEKLNGKIEAMTSKDEALRRDYDDLRYRHSQIETVLAEKSQEIDSLRDELNAQKGESKLVEELHREEMAEKDKIIKELQEKLNSKTKVRLNNGSISSFETQHSVFSPDPYKRSSVTSIGMEELEMEKDKERNAKHKIRYSSTAEVIQGELPVYKPAVTVDPSAGRDKWCGLCEREGHDSYECPFENDVF